MRLILYTKPGCHLCEGLQEKLEQIVEKQNWAESPRFANASLHLEVRDITTREDWFQAYQYEVPVVCKNTADREEQLPRLSPRATMQHLERMLQKYVINNDSQ